MFYYLKQIFHDSSIDLQGSLCTGALGISVFFLRYFSNISNLLKTGKNLLSSLFLTFQPKAVITDPGPPPGGVWGKINSNFTRPWGQGCGTILPSTLDHSLSYPHSQAGEAEIMGFVQALSADSGSYIYIYMGIHGFIYTQCVSPRQCKDKALLGLTGGFAVCFRYFYRYIPKGENTQLSTSQHCHTPAQQELGESP